MVHRSLSHNLPRKSNDERDRTNRFSVDHTRMKRESRSESKLESKLDPTKESIRESRMDSITRKRFSRQNSDLLQTAINQNYKSNLTRSISHHNMTRSMSSQPLSRQHQSPPRPQFKRWNSYNMSVKRESKPLVKQQNLKYFVNSDKSDTLSFNAPTTSGSNNSSVSPLTVLEDNYNIKRPVQSNGSSNLTATDNSFRNLHNNSSTSEFTNLQNSSTSNLSLHPVKPHNLDDSFNKHLLHKHSFYKGELPKDSSDETDAKNDSTEVDSYTVTNSNQSLDDASSEDDENDPDYNSGNEFQLDNDNVFSQYQTDTYASELFQEINDFQQNMVNKYYSSGPIIAENMNRTTKKLNDYKDLIAETPKTELVQFLNSYKVKIQYEKIVAQYTSIRCRFPTKLPTDKSRTKLKNGTAILGFIHRYEHLKTEKSAAENHSILESLVNNTTDMNQSRDQYLQTIWDQELAVFSHPDDDKLVDSISELAKNVKLN